MTQHFDLPAWTDFARQLVDATARSAMQVHLDTGCPTCRRRVAVAETMRQFAAVEPDQTPPASVVRLARAIFPVSSASPLRDLPRVLARIVADSFAQPLPAGVRSVAAASRHAVFEAGDYSIDIRVQRERDPRDLWLVGQVSPRTAAAAGVANAPVVLMCAETVIARTSCNAFGEFQIHYPAGQPGHLSVAIDDGQRCIDVDLAGLLPLGRPRTKGDGDGA